MQSMRRRVLNERRDELKELPRVDLVNHIRDYHDQDKLNVDDDGNKRDHQVGLMASVIEDRNYEMTDNQYYTMIDNFTKVTVPEMKVVGVSFRDNDAENFKKNLVGERRDGVVKIYDIDYHLKPEPENTFDENAVGIWMEDKDDELHQIGYLQKEFVAEHPIKEDMVVQGLMEDHSNGNFKNMSYHIAMDTETLNKDPDFGQCIESDDKGLHTDMDKLSNEQDYTQLEFSEEDLFGLEEDGLEL